MCDEFDQILNIEETIIKDAEKDAARDAPDLGKREGLELGFSRGYCYAREVFYYKSLALLLAQSNQYNEKQKLFLQALIEESQKFPTHNDDQVDILATVQRIRNKFKLVRISCKLGDHLDYSFQNKLSF